MAIFLNINIVFIFSSVDTNQFRLFHKKPVDKVAIMNDYSCTKSAYLDIFCIHLLFAGYEFFRPIIPILPILPFVQQEESTGGKYYLIDISFYNLIELFFLSFSCISLKVRSINWPNSSAYMLYIPCCQVYSRVVTLQETLIIFIQDFIASISNYFLYSLFHINQLVNKNKDYFNIAIDMNASVSLILTGVFLNTQDYYIFDQLENMQKITTNHQQIRGWEDHDQTQAYINLYNRLQPLRYAKVQPEKVDVGSQYSKLSTKESTKLSSINTRKPKIASKVIKQYKLRESEQLQNDKIVLLGYLKTSTIAEPTKQSNQQVITNQIQENQSIVFREQKQQSINQPYLTSITHKNAILHQKVTTLTHSSFQELFEKLHPQVKYKPKTSALKNKPLGQKVNTNNEKYRNRRMINFYYKNEIETEKHKELERQQVANVKPKSFPLYFREMEQKLQQEEKNVRRARHQFKLNKKKYKSQTSVLCVDNQQLMWQFTDENILTNKLI